MTSLAVTLPEWVGSAYEVAVVLVAFWLISGTLLNLSAHPHWYVRGWDFPRVIVLAFCLLTTLAFWPIWRGTWWHYAIGTALLACAAWQIVQVWPYLPLAKRQVMSAERATPASSIRLVASNVLMENTSFDLWRDVVLAADPDVILAVEVDDHWLNAAIRPLLDRYLYHELCPRPNYYGMALLSRLPIEGVRVRHVVQDDVPSIHATIRLRDGTAVRLIALHPRPPEPLRDQDSTPRDAELVIVGREIGDDPADPPTIVTGDLNDVAWSHTTRLFLRLSGLLDPRIGRGMFNTYHAKHTLIRFPLDHFFHSNDFRLIALRRLRDVGSDHFPMCIDLSYEPEAECEQVEPTPRGDDHEQADAMVRDQIEDERTGDEAGRLSRGKG